MPRPRVLVLAVPHVYATALARHVPPRYDVTTPDLGDGDFEPEHRVDAIITSLPIPAGWADVVITLPATFDDDVVVRIGELTVPVQVSGDAPVVEAVALLDRYLPGDVPAER